MEIGKVLGSICHWACAAADGGTALVLQVKWQDSQIEGQQKDASTCTNIVMFWELPLLLSIVGVSRIEVVIHAHLCLGPR